MNRDFEKIANELMQNNRWRKVGFLWMPTHLAVPSKKTAFERSTVVYVTYEEIFDTKHEEGNTEEIFFNHIKDFDFLDSLQALAKLNYLLSDLYFTRNKEEISLIAPIFDERTKKKIIGLWKNKRRIISWQQILALIKTNIIVNDVVFGKKKVGDDLRSFGRMIFRATSFLEKDLREKEQKTTNEVEKNRIYIGNFARNVMFNSSQQFRYVLPRYWTILFDCIDRAAKKFPDEAVPIGTEFKNATGLDLDLFILLGFGIFSHYSNTSGADMSKDPSKFLVGSQFFRNLKKEVSDEACKMFSLISSTKEEFARQFEIYDKKTGAGYYSFQPLYNKPLFKLNANNYFLLDKYYLQEKLTAGIYYTINEHLLSLSRKASGADKSSIKKRRNKFNQFLGRALEIYVSDIFRNLYLGASKRLYSEIDGDNTGGVDFVVVYPDVVFFFEVTALGLNHNTILTANIDDIEEEVKAIFFSKEGRKSKGKIVQLDAAIMQFKNGELDLGIDPKTIKNIYPILVLQKGLPYIPPMVDRYQQFIREKNYLKGCVSNFHVIDLEELEVLEGLTEKGGYLPLIFMGKQKSDYEKFPLKNYLLHINKGTMVRSERLGHQLDDFQKTAISRLFNKQA